MVQTISSQEVLPGEKKTILKKPYILHRIFFSIYTVAGQTAWHDLRISFDDPLFFSYYALNGPKKYFEATGVDIFQGNIWGWNNSDTDLLVAATEILR